MPDALLRQCAGCGALVAGRCPQCSSQRERRRGSARQRGYDTEWEKDTKVFKRAFPFCGMRPNGEKPVMSRCHDEGIVTPVCQVDHVIPHRGNPLLFKDPSRPVTQQPNWQSLCRECGARKSAAGL